MKKLLINILCLSIIALSIIFGENIDNAANKLLNLKHSTTLVVKK